jgi:hypothetical protein
MKTIGLIRIENFDQEVVAEKKPVLLLCMPHDEEFSKQVGILKNVAEIFSKDLKVAILEENLIEPVKKKYGFSGTPMLLILVDGKEKGRLLGLVDQEGIMGFVFQSLNQS